MLKEDSVAEKLRDRNGKPGVTLKAARGLGVNSPDKC
jgi:hypothetical protein